MIIYLDESGDLGFDFRKPKTSSRFVITLLVCNGRDTSSGFKKAVRRTLRKKLNNKKSAKRRVNELKATETTLAIKKYFFRHVPSEGWRLYSVALNKKRVEKSLRTPQGKKKLYNFLARFLLERVDLSNPGNGVTLVLDKCKNKEDISDFNNYVENQLEALLPLNIPLNIYHERSHENAGLQAVDLFCWGFYRKYEISDRAWYNCYKGAIAFETEYLP